MGCPAPVDVCCNRNKLGGLKCRTGPTVLYSRVEAACTYNMEVSCACLANAQVALMRVFTVTGTLCMDRTTKA